MKIKQYYMGLLAHFLAVFLLHSTKLWETYYIFLTLPVFYIAVYKKNSWPLHDIYWS